MNSTSHARGSLAIVLDLWRRDDTRVLAVVVLANSFGIEVSKIVRDTFFLDVAGASSIPYVYMCFAVVMVLASIGYARASRRFVTRALSQTSLTVSAILAVATWVGITSGCRALIFAGAVFVLVEMFFIFLPLTVWAVANECFGLQEGEKLLPALATWGLFGTVLGGLVTRFGTQLVGPYNLLLLVSISFLFARLYLPKLSGHEGASCRVDFESHPTSEGDVSFLQEPLVRTLTYLALPLWILAYLVEYTYFFSLGSVFSCAEDLATFLSTFLTVCSLSALLIQIFITPYLVHKVGVAATCFSYPAALACAATATLVYGLYPSAGQADGGVTFALICVLFARFLDMSLYQSVYESTLQILYYAVPQQSRVRARAFLGGILFPVSIACAGGLLVLFRSLDEPIYNVTFSAVVVGFLVVVMAMDIRPDYLRSLFRNRGSSSLGHGEVVSAELEHLPHNELRALLIEELYSDDADRVSFAIDRLHHLMDEGLVEELREQTTPLPECVQLQLGLSFHSEK